MRSRETFAKTEAAATDTQSASALTSSITSCACGETKSQRPSTIAASTLAPSTLATSTLAPASAAKPRAVARRCAATMPSWSHSSALAAPIDHRRHFAATCSNISSRCISESCFESRTPPSNTAGSSEKTISRLNIAIPTTSGPAQLPLPTSSMPMIVFAPRPNSDCSRVAFGHGLIFRTNTFQHESTQMHAGRR